MFAELMGGGGGVGIMATGYFTSMLLNSAILKQHSNN